jgi:deoxycytidylate deaminase
MELHERARVLANKSEMVHRHACIITHSGIIVSEGYNEWINHFSHKYSLHAEVVALSKVKHMPKWWLKQCRMYVYRLSNSDADKFRMSKPCRDCEKAILEASIGKVFYTCD